MSSPSENISFRLNSELLRKLDRQRDPFGDSRGQYARRLVITNLDRQSDELLQHQLNEIQASVALLDDAIHGRSDALTAAVRRLAFVLLTGEAPVSSEQAKQIAQEIVGQRTR